MRKRRTRGTWLPVIGTNIGESTSTAAGRAFALNVGGAPINGTGIITAITPLTFDVPIEGDSAVLGDSSLADIIGSEYVLQRIVGKVFAERISGIDGNDDDPNPAVLFSAGFFVARANDDQVGGGEDTPIGSATEAERTDNYSPLDADTSREPWIWRRTWILGAAGSIPSVPFPAGTGPLINAVRNYPASTALYGSVADGPHIDSRVKRRVSQDNRLFFAVSSCTFPIDSEPVAPVPIIVSGFLDYRLFGSLRKARGSSAF